jgi:nucleoside-diphosphate-sugar epimerase
LENKRLSVGVTGGSGFVGKRFLELNAAEFALTAIPLRTVPVADLQLQGLDAIVHFAGKAHQMEPIADAIYFEVNRDLALQLAQAAKGSGVKHFIYISSTKVYGDHPDGVLREGSECQPDDPYGRSKWEAEQALQAMATTDFIISIVRPPLVYGPEVKGNMIRLLQLAGKGYPLPFGKTGNARSMVFVDNLVALINAILRQQAGGIFLGGDRVSISTDQLITLMRKAMGKPARLVAIPGLFRMVLKKLRPALYVRLFGSFEVDPREGYRRLSFVPPYTTEEGIARMVAWFQQQTAQA